MWLFYALLMVLGWALSIVFDSTLVKHYVKNPFVLMWTQSCFSLLFLSIALPFISLQSTWIPLLVLGGLIAYCGDLIFFLAVDRMDGSVFNIAWAFLAIILSAVGFLLFSESWTPLQTLGVVCVLFGVTMLSCWHHHLTLPSLGLLVALAVLYSPVNVIMKAAADAGEKTLTVLFWILLARELCAFTFPWCLSRFRKRIAEFRMTIDSMFVLISGFVVAVYFTGEFFAVKAYSVGNISLVSVVGNIQPFVVLFLAWLLWLLVPRYSSRELFDWQSVRVKLASFCVVFVGMMLLTV